MSDMQFIVIAEDKVVGAHKTLAAAKRHADHIEKQHINATVAKEVRR